MSIELCKNARIWHRSIPISAIFTNIILIYVEIKAESPFFNDMLLAWQLQHINGMRATQTNNQGDEMNSVTIQKEENGTWSVDAGITGMGGFKTKRHAQYAMAIACWGHDIPSPRTVEGDIPDEWEY